MPEYTKACVYKIVAKADPEVALYVGSTCNFRRRAIGHKFNTNNERGKNNLYQFIRANGGWDEFEMLIVEDYPCETKEQLLLREGHWFNLFKPSLNQNRPGALVEAGGREAYSKAQSLAYYHEHQEEVNAQRRAYHHAHKEEVNAQKRAYHHAHKEEVNAQKRAYRKAHKEEISAYNRGKVKCECGATLSRGSTTKHRRSAKHKQQMAELDSN